LKHAVESHDVGQRVKQQIVAEQDGQIKVDDGEVDVELKRAGKDVIARSSRTVDDDKKRLGNVAGL
jgi:hypothetical protein